MGHGGGAHSTTRQSMVGRTVGSGGFVGVGRGSASARVACVIITSRDLPYGHYLVKHSTRLHVPYKLLLLPNLACHYYIWPVITAQRGKVHLS